MDQMSKALGLPELETKEVEIVDPKEDNLPIVGEDVKNIEAEEDFAQARENLSDLADAAMGAVKDLSEVAKQSQTARSYEALTTLIQAAVEANRTLVEIHNERKNPNKGPEKVTNQLVITTKDLLEIVNQKNANK